MTAPIVLSIERETVQPNGFADGVARMTVAASTDDGHAALVAKLRPAAGWVAHRSYMQEDGSYRVTYTYRPA